MPRSRKRSKPQRLADEHRATLPKKRVFRVKRTRAPATAAKGSVKGFKPLVFPKTGDGAVDRYIELCARQAETHFVKGWGKYPILEMKGGGAKGVEVRTAELIDGECVSKRYLVDTCDVKRGVVSKEEDFTLRREKIVANREVCNVIKGSWKPGHHIVVLDSPLGLTTEWFRDRIPIGCDALHVPNPDPKFRGVDGCVWFQKTLYEYVRDAPLDEHPTHFWLDYCCTLSGNAGTKPKIDIEMILIKGLLPRRGGVLCITVSIRAGLSEGLESWLTALGKRYGYRLKRGFAPIKYRSVALYAFTSH